MAEVYRALNPDLNQDVAIKVLHPHIIDSEIAIRRFRREAQAIAALKHRNIIQVYDFFAEANTAFMVMELLEGQTLQALLTTYPQGMPLSNAMLYFNQIARAVSYAHQQGIVHRDIKPANVLIDSSSRPVLMDFGLSHVAGMNKLTAPGVAAGTPTYIAPELIMGQEGGVQSDIYA